MSNAGQKPEVPPRPGAILPDERVQYQAMADLSDSEYKRLAEDIKQRGVLQPIIVDKDNTIIDGHHREALAQHFGLEGTREPAYITLVDLDTDGEKLSRAIKQNVIGRDSTDAIKQNAVKQYIETIWNRTDDDALIRPETDSEVASKLGVSRELVTKVVNRGNDTIIDHDRIQAREYYEDNPDASYREVARQVDSAKATVTKWIKEDFDESNDEGENEDESDSDETQETLNVLSESPSERDTAHEIAQKADESEAAEEAIEDVANKNADEKEAAKEVEKAEEEEEAEEKREDFEEKSEGEDSVSESEVVTVKHGDFTEILDEYDDGSIDHIITDPPYDRDALSLWKQLAQKASEKLKEGGYLVAYSGQSYLPQVYDILSDELNYIWQLTVTHESEGKHPYHSISIGYKPVLLFGKETNGYRGGLITDHVDIGGREKDDHEWQQPVREASEFVEKFTEPDDVICDPMCGSGTTGVAALKSQRQAVLIDVDKDAVTTARRRMEEVLESE